MHSNTCNRVLKSFILSAAVAPPRPQLCSCQSYFKLSQEAWRIMLSTTIEPKPWLHKPSTRGVTHPLDWRPSLVMEASFRQSVHKGARISKPFAQNKPPIWAYLLDACSHLLFNGFWSFLKPNGIYLDSTHTCLLPRIWNSTICVLCVWGLLFVFRLTTTLYAYLTSEWWHQPRVFHITMFPSCCG